MSHDNNTRWVEDAYVNFGQALEEENIELAKDIIQDTFDAGFPNDARKMNLELRTLSNLEIEA